MTLAAAIARTANRVGGLSPRQSLARRDHIPACYRGWNARDGLSVMKKEYASDIVNMWPNHGRVSVRPGTRHHAETGSAAIDGLFSFRSGATSKLYAAAGTNLYDVTPVTGNALIESPTSVATLTADRLNGANFGGRGFLVGDGQKPQQITVDAQGDVTVADHGFTIPSELTDTDLYHVMPWKRRLYFLEKDTANLWYAPHAGVQGELSKFDLSQIVPGGGPLVGMTSLTHDGGEGTDDYIAFFFASGGVAIYQGTGPGEGENFAIVGTWSLAPLLDERATTKWGADAVAAVQDGYIPLRQVLARPRDRDLAPLSGVIAPAVTEAVVNAGTAMGWQVVFHPEAQWLLVNVPEGGGVYSQHVMHVVTGAWTRFEGLAARVWGRHEGRLFYGDASGNVYEANVGHDDAGAQIEFHAQTAPQYIAGRNRKRIRQVRPIVESAANVSMQIGVGLDYGEAVVANAGLNIERKGAAWNTKAWNTFAWAGSPKVTARWTPIRQASGAAVAVRIAGEASVDELHWHGTDVRYERTGEA